MSRTARRALIVSLASATWLSATAPRSGAAVTREQVERAIRDGVRFLKQQQQPDGSWSGQTGTTALATLALLTAGEPADDPQMARALAVLRRMSPQAVNNTYAVALQTMAFAAADPTAYRAEIAQGVAWLERAQIRTPNPFARNRAALRRPTLSGEGSWSYNLGGAVNGDNSNTQYALLGLHAGSEAGIPVAPEVWMAARRYWENCQQNDGGWGYNLSRGHSTGSMTTAGISSLIITGLSRFQGEEVLVGEAIRQCGQGAYDPNLQRGIDWLARNFRVNSNPNSGGQWRYYYLYGLERSGRLAGLRFFGGHDWYREGAQQLVREQDLISGSWNADSGHLVSTSFALLFLAKGRAPVVVNKLRHGPGGDWNNDPDDVRNLVNLVSRDWKELLTWQVVDPDLASVDDLLQAPIAFLNGHEVPVLGEAAKENLREFVEQGGFLFAEACCGRPEFDRGFRDLMKEVFPEPDRELHPLSEEHPVWRVRHTLSPDVHALWGIEHGCRTVVIYSPADLSCYWNQSEDHPDNPSVVKAVRVGQNVVDYATGRDVPQKLDSPTAVHMKVEPARRGALHIAKLRHGGDWNVAPLAIPHLTTTLRDQLGFDVVINHREILPGDPNLINYPLVYIHGRSALLVSAEDRDRLRRHLEPGGGTIFADAACGSPAFDASFRRFVVGLLPGRALEAIPPGDDLYTRQVGYDLADVRYNKAAGGRTGLPELEGVKINGHWAIIYSKYDIGCALEHPQGIDCKGYSHDSALKIAANIVIYSTLP